MESMALNSALAFPINQDIHTLHILGLLKSLEIIPWFVR